MSNWDDEEYEVPVNQSWEDEEEVGVAESWEIDSDEEKNKPSEPTRKRIPMAVRAEEREREEQLKREKAAMTAAEEDEATKKERLRQAEIDSDLNNAASLFGQVDIHPRSRASAESTPQPGAAKVDQPGKLSDLALFKPKTKQDFENLRKTLVTILTDLAEDNTLQFSNFAIDFCRDLCKPLSSDQTRKVTSTLNALTNEKQRDERLGRTKKKKPMVKAASLKINEEKDTTNYDEFDDDDFM